LPRDGRRGHLLGVQVQAVLGIGSAGGPLTTQEEEEEKTHALIARTLLDLAQFFQSRPAYEAAAPVYLVGDIDVDGGTFGRAEQIAIAAFTILGLSRSVTVPLNLPFSAVDPFAFEVDEAQRVRWAGQPYDPASPFAVAGAYGVSCPAEPLVRLLAARLANLCLRRLGEQRGCAGLQEAGKLKVNPALGAFLADVEGRAAAVLWDQVAEKTEIPWPSETASRPPQWYDLERLRLLFGRLFDQKDWARVMAFYGENRMLALPLDLWPGALDELVALIEQGVLGRRRQQLAIVTHRILTAFLGAAEHGVAEVFGRTFREPVEAEPHLAAQAFLGKIRRHLEEAGERLEEVEAHERPQRPDAGALRASADKARQRFETELAEVPSPAAVILRLIPVFALCVGTMFALPFDLGLIDPAPLRLLAGALTGVLVAGYLYMRHLQGVRRRIFGVFRVWMEHYKAVLEFEDRLARDGAYRDLLNSMKDCLDWFFDGQTPEPPIPAPMRPRLKRHLEPAAVDPDLLKPQTVLADFSRYLADAAESFNAAEARFLEQFQVSRVETILPEISISAPEGIERELERVGASSDKVPPDWMRLLYAGRAGAPNEDWVLPFTSGSGHGCDHIWRASFRLPSPKDLLDGTTRNASSGFRFFDTLYTQIRAHFSDAFALTGRISQYCEPFPHQSITSTPLWDRYASLATPRAHAKSPQVSLLVLAAHGEDPLAGNLDWSNEAGADRLSLHLQVCNCISASDLIFYPNEASPTQAMGLAWKRHLQAPWSDPVFKPAQLPEEIA